MATYTPDAYQKLWRRRAVQLKKAAKKSSRDAAMFMTRTARGMAPSKSGNLRLGISEPISIGNNAYEVMSTVPGDFPYNLWVNQNAPYRSIEMKWNGFHPTVYGDGTHRQTGTARYWHFATLRTYNLFGKITRKNIQNVLKVRVG